MLRPSPNPNLQTWRIKRPRKRKTQPLLQKTRYLKSHCWASCRADTRGKSRPWLLSKSCTSCSDVWGPQCPAEALQQGRSIQPLCVSDDLPAGCSPCLCCIGCRTWGPRLLWCHSVLSGKKCFNYLFSNQPNFGPNKN